MQPGIDSGIAFAGLPLGHEFTSFILALLQVSGRAPKGRTIDSRPYQTNLSAFAFLRHMLVRRAIIVRMSYRR